jgi:hypothetical protein
MEEFLPIQSSWIPPEIEWDLAEELIACETASGSSDLLELLKQGQLEVSVLPLDVAERWSRQWDGDFRIQVVLAVAAAHGAKRATGKRVRFSYMM